MLGALLVAAPRDLTKNPDEGKRLIESAAEAGEALAQRLAGIAYISGDFGAFNPFRAAQLMRSAADAGDLTAMLHLARLQYNGIGGPTDAAAAEAYLSRAAEGGLTLAQEAYGNWWVARYRAKETDDASQGARWLEMAYQAGRSTAALVDLALLYSDLGRDLPWNDREKGTALFERCAGLQWGPCLFGYATAFHYAKGTGRDLVKAYTYYELARQRNLPVASERMTAIEKFLTPEDKQRALDIAQALRPTLRPAPWPVLLQGSDTPPPEAWAVRPQPVAVPKAAPSAAAQPLPAPQQAPAPVTQGPDPEPAH